MARFFKVLSCLMVMLCLLLVGHNAHAMGDTSLLEKPQQREPITQNPALIPVHNDTMRVVDIKLLQMRPTAGVGTGSILPFSIRDVRNTIDPEKRVAASRGSSSSSSSSGGGGPTSLITCADGTQFPTAGSFTNSILFNLPPSAGSCTLTLGPTSGANSVFVVNTFTSVNANISGVNGWAVNVSTLNSSTGAGSPTTIQVTKSGVTYQMVLTVSNNLGGGGNITVSSFTRL